MVDAIYPDMGFERFVDIPAETIEEALSLIDRGLQNYKISEATGLSNYYLRKIRKDHGRPPSRGNNIAIPCKSSRGAL